ncbi:MAG: protein kinase [bacterium]
MIGKTISHYNIIEKLGEGGMGVVYKADDTKLDRVVALKFLPQHLTTTDTERARFLQEARAAAALNHPNVCVIHEIQDAAEQPFIVMEYVDGKTIRAMVGATGPLALTEALQYAIPIGEALHEAHNNGIVHRDIKSENIMVNAKNQVKVMDFGLAKLKGSLKLTKSSSTLGTLAYMAPEQIQGQTVDARSDIFSFGVVLFEMLTGRLPFGGDYEAALMYSVLNEEPESLQKYLPDASSELIHVINRALEKAPEERYQNVGDMLIDLRRAKKETGKVSRKSLADRTVHTSTVPGRKFSPKLLGIAGGAIALLLLAFFFLRPDGSTKLNRTMSFRVLSTPYPVIGYPSLSPDGNWVSFPAKDPGGLWGVYFMNSAGGDARRIATDATQINGADISPDGSQVAYTRWFGSGMPATTFVVSSLGGQPRQLVEKGVYPEWRPDGQRIGYVLFASAGSGREEVRSVRPDGSDDRLEYVETAAPVAGGRIDFKWSPDGKSIAWLRTFPGPFVEIIIVDLQSGKERQLTFDEKIIDEVEWTNNDDIIFSSTRSGNTNLWMMPASGGEAIQITKGSGPDIGMAISADMKKLLYLQQFNIGHIWTAGSDGSEPRQLTFEDEHLEWPQLSHDGGKIVYVQGDPDPTKTGAVGNIYVMDRKGRNRRQLRAQNRAVQFPSWSPDDKWIVYQVGGDVSQSNVFVIPSDATGGTEPKFITKGAFPSWLDSQSILFQNRARRTNYRIALQGGEPAVIYQDSTSAVPIQGGEHIFFRDYHRGREGFYVISSVAAESQNFDAARKIGKLTNWRVSPSRRFLLQHSASGEIWKVSLPDGKRERLGGAFSNPNIEPESISFSYDDKEAVYVTKRVSGKLVLIEDFVK